MQKHPIVTARRRSAILPIVIGVGGSALALGSARATDPDVISGVTTQFTTLTGNASTLGLAFIGFVAALAVIGLAVGFLRKGHR